MSVQIYTRSYILKPKKEYQRFRKSDHERPKVPYNLRRKITRRICRINLQIVRDPDARVQQSVSTNLPTNRRREPIVRCMNVLFRRRARLGIMRHRGARVEYQSRSMDRLERAAPLRILFDRRRFCCAAPAARSSIPLTHAITDRTPKYVSGS